MRELEAWPGLQLVDRMAEGNRNEVWRARLDERPVSVRRSRRLADSLAWELDLIGRLAELGFIVPKVVATADGRLSDAGVVVQEWIEGRLPDSTADWRSVADELGRLHALNRDHPQRPGCCVVSELGRTSESVDADMSALPDEVAEHVLGLFRTFDDVPVGLIHGDPAQSNLRILPDGRVGLLDFDESRRDLLWHDLSNLGVQVLEDTAHARALRLSNAWEAANAWVVEPAYAAERLARLDD